MPSRMSSRDSNKPMHSFQARAYGRLTFGLRSSHVLLTVGSSFWYDPLRRSGDGSSARKSPSLAVPMACLGRVVATIRIGYDTRKYSSARNKQNGASASLERCSYASRCDDARCTAQLQACAIVLPSTLLTAGTGIVHRIAEVMKLVNDVLASVRP